jgi:AraC-like DNA-binding protein
MTFKMDRLMPIPYTRLYGIGALPKIVRQELGHEKYLGLLDEAGFPEAALRKRGKIVPHTTVLNLFNLADKLLPNPQQKIEVSRGMQAKEYGPWVDYALAGSDIQEFISRSGKTIYLHQNFGRLSLVQQGDHVKWSYWVDGIAPVPLHIEHAIFPMLQAIRSYCGRSWKPLRIELQYGDRRRQNMLEDYLQVPVWLKQPSNSVVFPVEELVRKRDAVSTKDKSIDMAWLKHTRRHATNYTQEAVMAAIENNIAHHKFDIGSLAKTLGMSTRSLQRELNAQGLTFRSILEQTRMQEAHRLLSHGSNNLTQIAVRLGYSDLPHFTRAFRRRFDIPPSAYANLIRNSLNIAAK